MIKKMLLCGLCISTLCFTSCEKETDFETADANIQLHNNNNNNNQENCEEDIDEDVVKGVVTNINGHPISGALVKIYKNNNLVTASTSDNNGKFETARVRNCTYIMETSHSTYQKSNINIDTHNNSNYHIRLIQ